MSLSQNILAIRKWLRDSQENFGIRFDVGRTAVAKWESGANEPPLSVVVTLEDLTGVPVSRIYRELLDGDDLTGPQAGLLREPNFKTSYSKTNPSFPQNEGQTDLMELVTSMKSLMESERDATAAERTENAALRKKMELMEKKIQMMDDEILRLAGNKKR